MLGSCCDTCDQEDREDQYDSEMDNMWSDREYLIQDELDEMLKELS